MTEIDASHLFDTLARLNQIGSAINLQRPDDLAGLKGTLNLVVESASGVIPGSSAVIYTYDQARQEFQIASRVSTEEAPFTSTNDDPRPDGMGARAITRRTRVLSYEEPSLEIHPAKLAIGAQVVACYPLMIAQEILGVLYIYLRERRSFTPLELLMLDNIVNLTSMSLAAARRYTLAQQEQSRKERELRRLRRAGMLISSRSSLEDTLKVILDMALEVTDAKYGIFRLVDKSGTRLVTQAIAGEGLDRPAVETLPIDDRSIMGLVAKRCEPLVIADLTEEPWKSVYYPLDHELVMRSELAVPLMGASSRLEGVLNLESPLINAFDKQDRYILETLATHAVTAIQEARLLDALLEISSLLLTQPLQEMYLSLVEKACDLLNVPLSLIWMLVDGHLVVQAASQPEIVGELSHLENTLAGQAVLTQKAVSSAELKGQQPVICADLPSVEAMGPALAVPLFASENRVKPGIPIGAFAVYSAPGDSRDFNQAEWDKKVLAILGHYAALAVQNAEHQDALRAAQEQRAVAEAFAVVGDIASNLLHRLNNKIGTIPVRVEGIQDKSGEVLRRDPYLSKNLAEIEQSASEALEVMRESLFHLRPIHISPVSVAIAVQEALAMANLPAGVQVRCQNLDHIPLVTAGPKRLALVFVNLLENAADAMHAQGTIEISATTREKWVELRVRDTGPGIKPELQERIFEFNYSSRSPESPGRLGFGLWWVKTLIARFGGTVSVESDGHSGTAFILSLPTSEVNA